MPRSSHPRALRMRDHGRQGRRRRHESGQARLRVCAQPSARRPGMLALASTASRVGEPRKRDTGEAPGRAHTGFLSLSLSLARARALSLLLSLSLSRSLSLALSLSPPFLALSLTHRRGAGARTHRFIRARVHSSHAQGVAPEIVFHFLGVARCDAHAPHGMLVHSRREPQFVAILQNLSSKFMLACGGW